MFFDQSHIAAISKSFTLRYIVLEKLEAKTDPKFGLAEKFNKRRYLDNGVTL